MTPPPPSKAEPARAATLASLRRPDLATWALTALGGVCYGAARLEAAWAWAAWLGVALLAAALARPQTAAHAGFAALLGLAAGMAVGLPWLDAMNQALFGAAPGPRLAALAIEYGVSAGSIALLVGLARATIGRRLPVWIWLPLAWAAGEAVRDLTLVQNLDGWLVTQWRNAPVLRLLGRIGWWPTLLACLAGAAAAGEAAARRSWRHGLPAMALGPALILLPALEAGPVQALSELGALHLLDTHTLPAAAPQGVRLAAWIWPEDALGLRPTLGEGGARARSVGPLAGLADVEHVVGAITVAPGIGRQNALVVTRRDGDVVQVRAKRQLMPFTERPAFGIGARIYAPGRAPPTLTVAGRQVGAIICGEVFDRALFAQVRASGAELLVVAARDGFLRTAQAQRLALGIQVLRSVEFGLPSVRASYQGPAAFVAADGTLLAESRPEVPGVLTWSPTRGAADFDLRGRPLDAEPEATPAPQIEVLYSEAAEELATRCPAGRCHWQPIEGLRCEDQPRREVVVVAGHGTDKAWLDRDAATVAAAVACFSPRLVVVDTCFGASVTLLEALARRSRAMVVASPRIVHGDGFRYGAAFFTGGSPADRAAAIADPNLQPLLRWNLDSEVLVRLRARVDAMQPDALGRALFRRNPASVRVDLDGHGPVVVPIDWRRLGSAPSPRRLHGRQRSRAPTPLPPD